MIREFLAGKVETAMKESTKSFFKLHGWEQAGQSLHAYYYLAHLDQ